MHWYKEPHGPGTFRQGLEIGDRAVFNQEGDKYTADGWEQIPVDVTVLGYGYPFIITNKGRFHYTRYVRKTNTQLSLF